MCSFIDLGCLKNGFAANSDTSLLLFSYADYCSIKFAKKAIKGKLIKKKKKVKSRSRSK